MSLFRRLSWSSDGAFIATTGGKDGTNNIAPLIERTSWNLSAALAGHMKPISVSRINPTLYKVPQTGNGKDTQGQHLAEFMAVSQDGQGLYKGQQLANFGDATRDCFDG